MGSDWDLISVEITDLTGLRTGHTILHTHGTNRCEGQFCCIHNPSPHHMVTWPQLWRSDLKIMERICPHDIGHPDPDHVSFVQKGGVHGCDGCCREGNND